MTIVESGSIGIPGAVAAQQDDLVAQITQLVGIQTFRTTPFDAAQEQEVQQRLGLIKEIFDSRVAQFNKDAASLQIELFEWQEQESEPLDRGRYWVFGYRIGKEFGTRKTTLMCHLDTVPPGSGHWNPFQGRVETRLYKGAPQPFLIGRGAIDDKGPAVVAFNTFMQVAREIVEAKARATKEGVDTDPLADVTLELLFDTSEETDMSTPRYFEASPKAIPYLGVVFDAYWSVRAEKGIERPVFSVNSDDVPTAPAGSLFISDMHTSPGPANMIPDWATASISGPGEALKHFAENVAAWYHSCPFDDPDYNPADLRVSYHDPAEGSAGQGVVELTTIVAGAQHGSAPNDNRRDGANPLVSLTCFLSTLIGQGILANNANGEMTKFIQWAFGTRVFGENHPDLLYRYDPVFTQGNGTTYALTQLSCTGDRTRTTVQLGLDIRYAIGHHSRGWDGKEGAMPGVSLFKEIFGQLVDKYQTDCAGAKVTMRTRTVDGFGPDVRSLRNANLSRVAMAYRTVMGENCPMHATGGGTDAHGISQLVAAGSLFTTDFGPPINYHGIDEGAPLVDLENSAKILHNLLSKELGA